MFTLAVSLSSGAFCGFLASMEVWNVPRTLFRDDDHICDVMDKYPDDYKTGDLDEPYHDEGKASYDDVMGTLRQIRNTFVNSKNEDAAIDTVVSKIWKDKMEDDEIDQEQAKEFLSFVVKKFEPSQEISD